MESLNERKMINLKDLNLTAKDVNGGFCFLSFAFSFFCFSVHYFTSFFEFRFQSHLISHLCESSTFFELKHLESCFRDTCGNVFCWVDFCFFAILYACTAHIIIILQSTVSLFVCLRKCHLLCSVYSIQHLIRNEFSKETIYNVFRKPIYRNLSEFLKSIFSKLAQQISLRMPIEAEAQ